MWGDIREYREIHGDVAFRIQGVGSLRLRVLEFRVAGLGV